MGYAQHPPCLRAGAMENGCGMAGMAGTVRVMRQTCNSVKMPSIMYISLSAGRFSAAWELSVVVVVMRSGRRER